VGTLRVSEGASVEVGGLRLGENAGSRGIVDVSNARLINHPTTVGQWVIGHLGSARFDVVKGGEVINDQSAGVIVAQAPGSMAKITLRDSGSQFYAGAVLGLGWDLSSNSAGGTCQVELGKGTTMRADQIIVGPRCTIKGKGTLQGAIVNQGGNIASSVTNVP
jgi:hypothetical protein